MDLDKAHEEMVAELSKGQTHIEQWDKWYFEPSRRFTGKPDGARL